LGYAGGPEPDVQPKVNLYHGADSNDKQQLVFEDVGITLSFAAVICLIGNFTGKWGSNGLRNTLSKNFLGGF